MRNPFVLIAAFALSASLASPVHAVRSWVVEGGTVSLALQDSHLATLGLEVVGARTTASPDAAAERVSGTTRAFAVDPAGLRFTSKGGAFQGFDSGSVVIPVRGGLGLAARDRVSSPVFLYDFRVELDPAQGKDAVRLLTSDPALSQPFDLANAGIMFREDRDALSVIFVDLSVSKGLALRLGRPDLEGATLGTLEVDLDVSTADALDRSEAPAPPDKETSAPLDLRLAELYGLSSYGRTGAYPNGMNGLSASTTSCNTGGVNIPWNQQMAETHPFIGLSVFRERDGVLEQIGINWIKHGFFALSNNQCGLGCSSSNGTYMGVGCSDTYSAGNNANRFYLGPRKEVNPYLGLWEACGSFFDEPVTPDAGCTQTYNGNEPNEVNHRIEVHDSDLGNPDAAYYYEGAYYVADDGLRENNIGWRQCTTSWDAPGNRWTFSTLGSGINQGLLIETWGDESKQAQVAAGDGEVVLAVAVTDAGGGTWHYEYALYNWCSDRGVCSFSVPVGGAPVSGEGFHDIDKNAANDWDITVENGFITWRTDDYVTDPNANALTYGRLYNFRFDTSAPPAAQTRAVGQVQCGIFKPGEGTAFFIDTRVPDTSATAVSELQGRASDLALSAVEPNPFATSTRIAFSLPRRQNTKLSVIDVTGRTVRVLLDGDAPAGTRDVRWDGRDNDGRNVASGVYMVRLETADGVRTAKVARLH
jgi:hypothetical protein